MGPCPWIYNQVAKKIISENEISEGRFFMNGYIFMQMILQLLSSNIILG